MLFHGVFIMQAKPVSVHTHVSPLTDCDAPFQLFASLKNTRLHSIGVWLGQAVEKLLALEI
jgi:hypothetical protein